MSTGVDVTETMKAMLEEQQRAEAAEARAIKAEDVGNEWRKLYEAQKETLGRLEARVGELKAALEKSVHSLDITADFLAHDWPSGEGSGTVQGIRYDAQQARAGLSGSPAPVGEAPLLLPNELRDEMRDWSRTDAVQQVFTDGYAKNSTGADTAIFTAGNLLAECGKAIGCNETEQAVVDAVMNADPAYLPYSIRCARDRLAMAREIGEREAEG